MRFMMNSRQLVLFGVTFVVACGTQMSPSSQTADTPQTSQSSKTGYRLANKYTLGGDAGWDYIAFDVDTRRVFVTHYMKIEVLDGDSGKSVGQITGTPGVHGIALVQSIGKSFTSNGKADSVSDPGTDRVFVSNGESGDLTIIDPMAGKAVGTVPLGGAPEYSAADGKGTLWVNLEDKNAFVTVDVKGRKVTKTTPIAGCEEPASMALDSSNRRLFIGCKNRVLAVVNPDTEKVVASLPIGEHVDATIFDPANGLIFASTGDGVLTIVHQDSPDAYTIVDNVKTMRGAKTLALDPKTGKLFTATVENVPLNATAPPKPIGPVAYVPGPFVVLTIEK